LLRTFPLNRLSFAEFVVPLVKVMQELADRVGGKQEFTDVHQEELVEHEILTERPQEQIDTLIILIEKR
jgi:hypothetical protein